MKQLELISLSQIQVLFLFGVGLSLSLSFDELLIFKGMKYSLKDDEQETLEIRFPSGPVNLIFLPSFQENQVFFSVLFCTFSLYSSFLPFFLFSKQRRMLLFLKRKCFDRKVSFLGHLDYQIMMLLHLLQAMKQK